MQIIKLTKMSHIEWALFYTVNNCFTSIPNQPTNQRCRSKKISKLRVTGLCVGNSPVTGEFPARMASNTENVSIWWRHHEVGRLLCKTIQSHWNMLYFHGFTTSLEPIPRRHIKVFVRVPEESLANLAYILLMSSLPQYHYPANNDNDTVVEVRPLQSDLGIHAWTSII